MSHSAFKIMGPDQLRNYVETHKEKAYLLVDVRTAGEYAREHIPGAKLIPLDLLEDQCAKLPTDRDIIFYCRSGARSAAAATIAADLNFNRKTLYNLKGGIIHWNGKILIETPKIETFDPAAGSEQLLMTAMNLEKGAYLYYRHIHQLHPDQAFSATIDKLSKAESAHARAIYHFWRETAAKPLPFEKIFDQLPGEVLEGGESFAAAVKRIERLEGDPCLNILETALNIELAAYDLYRVMAENDADPKAVEVFLGVAQAEKRHMRMIADAIAQC